MLTMNCDVHSLGGMTGRYHTFEKPGSDIKKTGYMKKLKTMKRKFFVLRSTSSSGPARLEYYDNEKKFHSGHLPKRSIQLHTCFNINRKSDGRHGRHGLVLFTNQEAFAVQAECEEDQESWLGVMLEYQNEYLPDGDMHREHYDNVWQVIVQPRGLGQSRGAKGPYRMCLNSTEVSLFRANLSQPQFAIQLVTIRAVAHNENSFWMEVGNYAQTGPGEFFFVVEDADVAKDMHTAILQSMSSVKDPAAQKESHGHYKRESQLSIRDEFMGSHHSDSRSHTKIGQKDDSSIYIMGDQKGDYQNMKDLSHPHSVSLPNGETRSSHTDTSSTAYIPMLGHHGSQSSNPFSISQSNHSFSVPSRHSFPISQPIHPFPVHTNFSESLHTAPLPTVREGGSTEGYLPMDNPSSSASSSDLPRPEPVTCLLSDDSADLPPRTYSLGSRPKKKYHGYAEMGSRRGAGGDMSRATSAPHILKGRREREHTTGSPTPSGSSLSMSLKSDDSDSFMDYMPMRPRTSSDSFNYRPRTSSFGKLQQMCRPRSSSYGQGKRPVINMSMLGVDRTRTSQDLMQRTSRESSLQSSLDSLHVSNESLTRLSQEQRWMVGNDAGDRADARHAPLPQTKNSDSVGYVDMQAGASGRRFSPHRTRTDSSSSGTHSDVKSGSSDRPIQQLETTSVLNRCGDLASNTREWTNPRPIPQGSLIQASPHEDAHYINIDLNCQNKSDMAWSISTENVAYITENHLNGSKPRTMSLGSKDKKLWRPGQARKSSSASSTSASSSSGAAHHQPHPLISASALIGGSSDSIKRTSQQMSSDNSGSVGKDFRKKSCSIGSKPSTTKFSFGVSRGKEQQLSRVSISSSASLSKEDPAGEYIEFPVNVTRGDANPQPSHRHAGTAIKPSAHVTAVRSGSSASWSTHAAKPSLPDLEPNRYVMYNPPLPSAKLSYRSNESEYVAYDPGRISETFLQDPPLTVKRVTNFWHEVSFIHHNFPQPDCRGAVSHLNGIRSNGVVRLTRPAQTVLSTTTTDIAPPANMQTQACSNGNLDPSHQSGAAASSSPPLSSTSPLTRDPSQIMKEDKESRNPGVSTAGMNLDNTSSPSDRESENPGESIPIMNPGNASSASGGDIGLSNDDSLPQLEGDFNSRISRRGYDCSNNHSQEQVHEHLSHHNSCPPFSPTVPHELQFQPLSSQASTQGSCCTSRNEHSGGSSVSDSLAPSASTSILWRKSQNLSHGSCCGESLDSERTLGKETNSYSDFTTNVADGKNKIQTSDEQGSLEKNVLTTELFSNPGSDMSSPSTVQSLEVGIRHNTGNWSIKSDMGSNDKQGGCNINHPEDTPQMQNQLPDLISGTPEEAATKLEDLHFTESPEGCLRSSDLPQS